LADVATLPAVPPHELPGETVPYLLDSLYCPATRFQTYVESEFCGLEGGALIAAFRDFIHDRFRYVAGASGLETTALDTFVRREGVCRDYAHLLITLARAAAIPARMASVYAIGVDPPDFHAVAEVFLGGEWHLVDATGMASEGQMAKIGIGRDAADVAFLSAFGRCEMVEQKVEVREA
ncbi:MAG TPA: transglutaminase family protein, partial [Allosphingosinicella sp.]